MQSKLLELIISSAILAIILVMSLSLFINIRSNLKEKIDIYKSRIELQQQYLFEFE